MRIPVRPLALLLCAGAAAARAGTQPSLSDWVLSRYTRPRAVAGGGNLHLLYQSNPFGTTCYRRLVPGKGWQEEVRLHNEYLTAGYFADALLLFRPSSYSVYRKEVWKTHSWEQPWLPAAACRMGQELWVVGPEERDGQHRLRAARFTQGEGQRRIRGPAPMGDPLALSGRPEDLFAVARGTEGVVFWLQALAAEPQDEPANELWMATFDGEQWGEPAVVPMPYRNTDYAVAAWEGRLWVFAKARGHRITEERPLQVLREREEGWTEPEPVPGAADRSQMNWTYDVAAAAFQDSLLVIRARTADVAILRWRDGQWGDEEFLAEVPLWWAYVLPWALGNGLAVLVLIPVAAFCAHREARRPRTLRLGPGVAVRAARWSRRTAAMLVDTLLGLLLWVLARSVILLVHGPNGALPPLPVLEAGFHVVFFYAYFVLCEWLAGQTLGKRLLGIRVLGQDARRPTLAAIVLRNLLRPPLLLPAAYVVGSIVLLVTPRRQRVGDLLGGTVVIGPPPRPPVA
ncbi:MAG: RDD family protein [Planctomycetota bacterium]